MNMIWEAVAIYFFFYLWNHSIIVEAMGIKPLVYQYFRPNMIESMECAFCSGFWVALAAFAMTLMVNGTTDLWLSVFIVPVLTLFLEKIYCYLSHGTTSTSVYVNQPTNSDSFATKSITWNEGAMDEKKY